MLAINDPPDKPRVRSPLLRFIVTMALAALAAAWIVFSGQDQMAS